MEVIRVTQQSLIARCIVQFRFVRIFATFFFSHCCTKKTNATLHSVSRKLLRENGRISLEFSKFCTQAEKRYINRSIQGFVYRRLSDSIILFPRLIDGRGLVVRFDRSPSQHRYRLRVSHPYVSVSIINNRKRKEWSTGARISLDSRAGKRYEYLCAQVCTNRACTFGRELFGGFQGG